MSCKLWKLISFKKKTVVTNSNINWLYIRYMQFKIRYSYNLFKDCLVLGIKYIFKVSIPKLNCFNTFSNLIETILLQSKSFYQTMLLVKWCSGKNLNWKINTFENMEESIDINRHRTKMSISKQLWKNQSYTICIRSLKTKTRKWN